MKKLISLILITVIAITALTACGTTANQENTYTVGICNFVDDASLNQIIANIKAQLEKIAGMNYWNLLKRAEAAREA